MLIEKIYSVSEINQLVKKTLENNFSEFTLIGELTNFKPYFSGHWYFSLKDENSQISCTMWKSRNTYVFFTPQDGMKLKITGKLSVYEVRGTYQIDVIKMEPMGAGELQIAFEKLKEKLFSEGLFDVKYKKSIPRLPINVGIITSREAAALRDVISTIRRRFPKIELTLFHSSVQGKEAIDELVNAIEQMNQFNEVEVIILCRGGGSIEDLWAFNEEKVARAIFNSKIPIITGIGHEVDTTIADFVADFRASTPTAAAEIVTPLISELYLSLHEANRSLYKIILEDLNSQKREIEQLLKYRISSIFTSKVNTNRQTLDLIIYKINSRTEKILLDYKSKIFTILKIIKNFNPEFILKKGYAIIRQENKIINQIKDIHLEKELSIHLSDGEIKANVKKENDF